MATRVPDHPVDPQFPERWSPRSYASRPVDDATLLSVFEAARWAPSGGNGQPWVFIYARDGEAREVMNGLLWDSNLRWARHAPVLVIAFAHNKTSSGNLNRTAMFDVGAAWMALALQARKLGLVTRAMGGIHADAACATLGLADEDYEAICAIALGYPGDAATLPPDLQAKEAAGPTPRKPVREFLMEGRFRR